MNAFTAFSSSLGPLHLAPPNLPAFRSIAALFSSKAPKSSSSSSPRKGSVSLKSSSASPAPTYTPSVHASTLPPTYHEAVGLSEDLEYSDAEPTGQKEAGEEKVSMEVVERRMQAWDVESRRERLVREDRRMGAKLSSIGF